MENVELKRKVTLKRKGEADEPKPPKSKLWLWLLLLAVVAVVVVLCVKFCGNDDKATVTEPETVEEPATMPTEESPIMGAEDVTIESETTTETVVAETPVEVETPATPKIEPTPAEPATKSVPVQKPTQTLPQGNLDEKARQVIRGDFGNGAERKQTLGNEYNAIQQRVNEMYREGKVN